MAAGTRALRRDLRISVAWFMAPSLRRINENSLNVGERYLANPHRDCVQAGCFTSGYLLTHAITAYMAVHDRNPGSHESNAGGIRERLQCAHRASEAIAEMGNRRMLAECYLKLSNQVSALCYDFDGIGLMTT